MVLVPWQGLYFGHTLDQEDFPWLEHYVRLGQALMVDQDMVVEPDPA